MNPPASSGSTPPTAKAGVVTLAACSAFGNYSSPSSAWLPKGFFFLSRCEYTEINSAMFMLHAPATRSARPETTMAGLAGLTAPTPSIREETETRPSLAPGAEGGGAALAMARMSARIFFFFTLKKINYFSFARPVAPHRFSPSSCAIYTLTIIHPLYFFLSPFEESLEGPPGTAAEQRNAAVEKTPFDSELPSLALTKRSGSEPPSLALTRGGARIFSRIGPRRFAGRVRIGSREAIRSDRQPRWSSHGCLRLNSHRERKKKPFGSQADNGEEKLPNALQAAGVSALVFTAGGVLRLPAGGFIGLHWVRMGVVLAVSSLELAGSRVAGAVVGGSSVAKSTVTGVVGGWVAMIVTFGVLRILILALKTSVVG
ncbi:Vacuolar iron transporter-like protein 4 [Nymphaea thermarum]|nr:Vacuolar iron transporter-like protein 4 [Nymphaea thermarum]